MNNKLFSTLPLFIAVTIFFSCKGQEASDIILYSTTVIGDTIDRIDGTIMVVFQDGNDNYWFGSKTKGVYKYDGKSLVQFTKKHGLCSNGVRGIQEDKNGEIYFDTVHAISKYDGKKFETLTAIRNTMMVQNKWELSPDDLWFGGKWGENGAYRYDGETLYHLEFPKADIHQEFLDKYPNITFSPYDVYALYKDKNGYMWFGTVTFGVCRFDGKNVSWIIEEELRELEDGRAPGVRAILEDKNGHFWFSNILNKYEILSDSTHTLQYKRLQGIDKAKKGKLNFPYLMSMTNDQNGNLWMVSYAEGVWKYDGEQLSHYPILKNNQQIKLYSINTDNHGNIWIGTHDEGVYKLNGSVFEKFLPRTKGS